MKELGRLSETEWEVMTAIWEMPVPVTVAELLSRFEQEKKWKTSTLSTLLARLMEKGFLTKTMTGKTNFYTPVMTQEAYKNYRTQTFLQTVHGGSMRSFMAALTGGETLPPEEIAALRSWLRALTDEEQP